MTNHVTKKSPFVAWNWSLNPNSDQKIISNIERLQERIKSSNSDVIDVIGEVESVHAELFRDLDVEADGRLMIGGAGIIRERPVIIRRKIFNKEVIVNLPSHEVIPVALNNLRQMIQSYSVLVKKEDSFKGACQIFVEVCRLHPFYDGNGHVARFLFEALLGSKEIRLLGGWRVHPRPYTESLCFLINNYQLYPDALESYMKKFVVNLNLDALRGSHEFTDT